MVEVRIDYLGDLRCVAHHGPSGETLKTDAPVDNNGRGEFFSSTDLLAVALGTCMETIMGITAARKGVSLEGLRIVVQKHMSDDLPRRIASLAVDIYMPIAEDHHEKKLLQSAALSCPVHHSLHPDIEIPIRWFWRRMPNDEAEESAENSTSPESKELRSNAAELAHHENEGVGDELEKSIEPENQTKDVEESPLTWLKRASGQVED